MVPLGQDLQVTVTPADLPELLARWGVPKTAGLAAPAHGTNNQTFAIGQGNRRWVLRISQNLSPAQVRAEHRLLARLHRADLPFGVPEPVATVDGETVVPTPAGPATLCRRLPGIRPDLGSELALQRFGRAMAELGEAMRPVPPGDAPHDWRGDQLQVHPAVPDVGELCLELRAAGVRREQAMMLQAAAERAAACWPAADSALPVQVIHGDLAASNMLVDGHTGQVTAVLDFEIAGTDFWVQDLVAGLLQSGALDGPGWQRRAAALVRGNASVRRLDDAEIQAVPDLLLCRSVGSVLWRAGRWRRGQADLGEVIARLDDLGATTRWLPTFAGQLRSVIGQPPGIAVQLQ
jgi:homoserine kinase type II